MTDTEVRTSSSASSRALRTVLKRAAVNLLCLVVAMTVTVVVGERLVRPLTDTLVLRPPADAPVTDVVSQEVARETARLGRAYGCSSQGLPSGMIPSHAVVQRHGRVLLTSFDAGWAVYQGQAPGTLLSVCSR